MESVVSQLETLSDQMEVLDHNMTKLSFIHENLSSFNESNGALLYGIMCNTLCIDMSSNQFDKNNVKEEINMVDKIGNLEKQIQEIQNQIHKLEHPIEEPLKQRNSEKKSIYAAATTTTTTTNSTNRNGSRVRANTQRTLNNRSIPIAHSNPITHSSTSGPGSRLYQQNQRQERYEDDTDSSFVTNPEPSMIRRPTNVDSLTNRNNNNRDSIKGVAEHGMAERDNTHRGELGDTDILQKKRRITIMDSIRQKESNEHQNYRRKRMSLAVGAIRNNPMGPPPKTPSATNRNSNYQMPYSHSSTIGRARDSKTNDLKRRYTDTTNTRNGRPSYR